MNDKCKKGFTIMMNLHFNPLYVLYCFGALSKLYSSLFILYEVLPSFSDEFFPLFVEESTVTVEGHGRNRTRSLTLEEATDTILFCSSIVHDLAYSAVSIAMDKEQETSEGLEGFRPTVTIVGKSISSSRKDLRSGRIISKRGPKPPSKALRQKRIDTNKKPPSSKPENDENVDESLTHNVGLSHKFDSTKPPKLESKCNCAIM